MPFCLTEPLAAVQGWVGTGKNSYKLQCSGELPMSFPKVCYGFLGELVSRRVAETADLFWRGYQGAGGVVLLFILFLLLLLFSVQLRK